MSYKPIVTNDAGEIQCTKCLEFKAIDNFLKRKDRGGSPYRICRGCQTLARKANYKPWMQKIYQKNWKIIHRDKVQEYRKREYLHNRESIRAKQNEYQRSAAFKKKRQAKYREKYEAGNTVYYQNVAYKIIGPTNRGYKITRYGLQIPIIVPRKNLSFSKKSLPSTIH